MTQLDLIKRDLEVSWWKGFAWGMLVMFGINLTIGILDNFFHIL